MLNYDYVPFYWTVETMWVGKFDVSHRKGFTLSSNKTKFFEWPFFCYMNAAIVEPNDVRVIASMETTLPNLGWACWKSALLQRKSRLHKHFEHFTRDHILLCHPIGQFLTWGTYPAKKSSWRKKKKRISKKSLSGHLWTHFQSVPYTLVVLLYCF